jgi:plastocyanin
MIMALAIPAAAQAATKQVYMGLPVKSQKEFNQNLSADVDDFFPHSITVNVGQKVQFLPVGFHTADFPAKGQTPLSLIVPNGQTVSGVNDALGAPFWFNGQAQVGFNPALAQGLYGKTVKVTGSKRVETGLPLQNHPKPVTLSFAKAGTYTYYCNVHPGMKGVVHVVGKKAKAPSTKVDAKTVATQLKTDLGIAKKLAATKVPAGQVDVGYHAPNGVEYFGFLPGDLSVAAGTTITFSMTKGSFEDHTATFGPGNPETEPNSYLGQIAASFNSPVFDPRGVYPSDPPGTPASFGPQLHGNGFWNSGVLDTTSATPLPSKNVVRFDTPGKYDYYCVIHPFMHGTITVTG